MRRHVEIVGGRVPRSCEIRCRPVCSYCCSVLWKSRIPVQDRDTDTSSLLNSALLSSTQLSHGRSASRMMRFIRRGRPGAWSPVRHRSCQQSAASPLRAAWRAVASPSAAPARVAAAWVSRSGAASSQEPRARRRAAAPVRPPAPLGCWAGRPGWCVSSARRTSLRASGWASS